RFGAVERPPVLLEIGGCGFLQFFDFTDKSRRRCRDFALHVLPALQRRQSHTLLWFACQASQGAHGSIRLPIAPSEGMTLGKLRETTRFTRRPEQTSRQARTAQGDSERNGNRETGQGKRAQAYPTLLNIGPEQSCPD